MVEIFSYTVDPFLLHRHHPRGLDSMDYSLCKDSLCIQQNHDHVYNLNILHLVETILFDTEFGTSYMPIEQVKFKEYDIPVISVIMYISMHLNTSLFL